MQSSNQKPVCKSRTTPNRDNIYIYKTVSRNYKYHKRVRERKIINHKLTYINRLFCHEIHAENSSWLSVRKAVTRLTRFGSNSGSCLAKLKWQEVRSRVGTRNLSLPDNVQTGSGAHRVYCQCEIGAFLMEGGKCSWWLELTTHEIYIQCRD
jgi:hypothetical protein